MNPQDKNKGTKTTPWWSAYPRAHMFSGLAVLDQFPKKVTRQDVLIKGWRQILWMDVALMKMAKRCQNKRNVAGACSKKLANVVKKRTTTIVNMMPVWKQVAQKSKSGVDRDKATYQIGVGTMLMGHHVVGLKQLKSLANGKEDTPYKALSLATMADYFYTQGQYKSARSLYLSVANMRFEGLASYAHYMQGWCNAQLGKMTWTMQAMVVSYKLLANRPHQLQGGMLKQYVLADLALAYAVVGQANRADEFIAQFKLRDGVRRGWLSRVGRHYAEGKKYKDAMHIYQRLAYKASPRQTAYYGHQWLGVREKQTPLVDQTWQTVMINWLGAVAALETMKPIPKEVKVYQREALYRQRTCTAQSQLRPKLANICMVVMKSYVTKFSVASNLDEVLFMYAQLAKAQKKDKDERWALQQLIKRPKSAYTSNAMLRLKVLGKTLKQK